MGWEVSHLYWHRGMNPKFLGVTKLNRLTWYEKKNDKKNIYKI